MPATLQTLVHREILAIDYTDVHPVRLHRRDEANHPFGRVVALFPAQVNPWKTLETSEPQTEPRAIAQFFPPCAGALLLSPDISKSFNTTLPHVCCALIFLFFLLLLLLVLAHLVLLLLFLLLLLLVLLSNLLHLLPSLHCIPSSFGVSIETRPPPISRTRRRPPFDDLVTWARLNIFWRSRAGPGAPGLRTVLFTPFVEASA